MADQAHATAGPTVLVLAAGRRTSLVSAFVDATRRRGGRVIAGDVDALAPALFLADAAIQLPPTGDARYLPELLTLVRAHAVRLIVPTIDTDLPVVAAATAKFADAGCQVAVSSPEFVQITIDKENTGVAFGGVGIAVPDSWLPPLEDVDRLPERLVVKPRRGSASQDVYRIDRTELASVLGLVPDPIIQEELDGPEITIDALLDLEGRPIHYVPRRRIRTLGGESIQGVTLEHDASIESWIEELLGICAQMGARGPLTLQAFLTARGPVLSEVNPRFGGGFPLALAAGGAYPDWLLDMIEGRSVPPRLGAYEAGLYMTRYHVERFMRSPAW